MRYFAPIFFLLVLSACHKQEEPKSFEKRNVGSGVTTIIIPNAVWKSVESEYAVHNAIKEGGEGGEKQEEGRSEKKSEVKAGGHALKVNKEDLDHLLKKIPPTEKFPIEVLLTEKTDGVLGGKNYKLSFPAGGGTLDLAYYVVDGKRGSFYLNTSWDKDGLPPSATKVYFVSRSKVREMESAKIGSGCDHFLDLTTYWLKSMGMGGLFLNTTHDRHISVLAGNYYFMVFKDGKIFEAYLEILDSRHRDLMCVPSESL